MKKLRHCHATWLLVSRGTSAGSYADLYARNLADLSTELCTDGGPEFRDSAAHLASCWGGGAVRLYAVDVVAVIRATKIEVETRIDIFLSRTRASAAVRTA